MLRSLRRRRNRRRSELSIAPNSQSLCRRPRALPPTRPARNPCPCHPLRLWLKLLKPSTRNPVRQALPEPRWRPPPNKRLASPG
ncbi:MAG: hypothetical protein EPN75_04770 [Beijerinckiaceae bacterium]|nr:MAG: hypothetical protein EPN75_04770 [Beijerinckiaceae bacterium]